MNEEPLERPEKRDGSPDTKPLRWSGQRFEWDAPVPRELTRHYAIAVALLFLFALAVRLYPALRTTRVESDAAGYYLPIAEAMYRDEPLPRRHVEVPILYSQMTAVVARGVGDVALAARLTSVLGGMIACTFVFLLARHLFGPYAAIVALSLMAFHPYEVRYSAETGIDALAAGWFCAATYLLVRYIGSPRSWRAVALGVMAALMTLTRPEGFVYAGAIIVLAAVYPVGGRFRLAPVRLLHALVIFAVAAALCVPRLSQVHRDTGYWAVDTRWVQVPKSVARRYSAAIVEEGGKPVLNYMSRRGLLDWGESVAAAMGPLTLLAGGFALYLRRGQGRPGEWTTLIMMAVNFVVVTIGSRASRRYYLPMGSIWQAWGGAGFFAVASYAMLGASRAVRGRWVSFSLAAALLAAVALSPQVLPALVEVNPSEHSPERAMGRWILENRGRGRRMLARRPPVIWYARGEYVSLNPVHFAWRDWTKDEWLRFMQDNKVEILILDHAADEWCPEVAAEVRAGNLPWARIIHEEPEKSGTLQAVELKWEESTGADPTPRESPQNTPNVVE